MRESPSTVTAASSVVALVEASFALEPGCGILFEDEVEVRLDCPVCRRTGRTIVFNAMAGTAVCTPTGHRFPGMLEDKARSEDAGRPVVTYRLRYQTAPFYDVDEHEPSVPHPTWGRVHFLLACPKCGQRNSNSAQNNIVRPFTHACVRCRTKLWTDSEEMPRFRLLNECGDVTYRLDRSTTLLSVQDFDGLPAKVQRTLAKTIGVPTESLARRARDGQPIYQEHPYEVRDSKQYRPNLERMAFALIKADAEFQLLHNDRDLRGHYVHWFKQRR